jgi:leucine-rich repeat protein SHOC2
MTIASVAELEELIEIVKFGALALDLYGCQLEHLPENIGDLLYLRTLKFNGNRITKLPESIGNLKHLNTLSLNGHRLTSLPESIGNLVNLTHLSLNGDRLTSLPDSIANLTQLIELNLNSNQLDSLPESLLSLPNLQKLNLDSNPLADLSNLKNIPNLRISRSPTRSKFKLVKLKQSIKLVVGDRYLESIIANLSTFPNIVSIGLNGYYIATTESGDCVPMLDREAIENIIFSLSTLPNLATFCWHIDLFPYLKQLEVSTSINSICFLGISLDRHVWSDLSSVKQIKIKSSRWIKFSLLSKFPNAEIIYHNQLYFYNVLSRRYWNEFSNCKQEWLLSENNRTIRQILIEKTRYSIDILIEAAMRSRLQKINLSGLSLRAISDSIGDLCNLTHLDLSDNKLRKLPAALERLNKLESIDLSNNPLIDWSVVSRLPNLKVIHFDGDCFDGNLTNHTLPRRYWTKCSDWKIEWLLEEDDEVLRRLIVKKIGFNIDRLIESASQTGIDRLNLRYLSLKELPDNIGTLTNLTYLDLRDNQLTNLPDSLANLTNLQSIELAGNPLSEWSILGKLPSLEVVEFVDSDFDKKQLDRRYWSKFSDWKQEWLLDESSPKLRLSIINTVGYDLDKLIQIAIRDRYTEINLSGLQLDVLPDTIGDIASLNILDLVNNNLTRLPHSIGNLRNLKRIDLGVNKLVEIPGSICNLTKLTKLNLVGHELITLPKNIGDMTNLTELNLYNSKLCVLPNSIGNLTKLTKLSLERNNLTELPHSIGNLINLTSINLTGNKIDDVPSSIGNLTKLTKLFLDNNNLTNLPESIGDMTDLTELHLQGNSLSTLPNSINNLTKLTRLDLNGNQLSDLSMLENLSNLQYVRFLGIDLPRRYWTKFSEWNPEWLLDENNAEIRRALIDRVGYEKICEVLKAIELDTWREYTLIKIDNFQPVFDRSLQSISKEPIVLLKMTCPSTGHIHLLRVPPDIQSAEAAIVWVNHGIHPDNIAIQT